MKNKNSITVLVVCIAILAVVAALSGIFSADGPGPYEYQSIRNKTVLIYGKGLYKHMSAEVAPQGIAQDYVTLIVAVPMLLVSLLLARKGSVKGRFLLTGTLGYFLVTYLFYTVMGMYNQLFLVYVALIGAAFYCFLLTLTAFDLNTIQDAFQTDPPVKTTGSFLIITSIAIGFLWLSIVVPPLTDGSVIPVQVEHYTTLIVQGLDLGILLPGAFIAGILWLRRRPLGYLLAPVYLIFLSLLMLALTAKVLAMKLLGYNVIPVIFIIPTFTLLAILSSVFILKHLKTSK